MSRIAATIFVATICAPILTAQQPTPKFEVASVKPTESRKIGPNIVPRAWPGGRFGADHATVDLLIWFAYGVRTDLIVGGPDWVRQDLFEISAKAEDDAPAAEIKLMVRSLLEERFKLVMHMERRAMQVLALVRARPDGPLGSSLIRIDECSPAMVTKLRRDSPDKFPTGVAGSLSSCSSMGLGDLALSVPRDSVPRQTRNATGGPAATFARPELRRPR